LEKLQLFLTALKRLKFGRSSEKQHPDRSRPWPHQDPAAVGLCPRRPAVGRCEPARKIFDVHESTKSPIAAAALTKIGELAGEGPEHTSRQLTPSSRGAAAPWRSMRLDCLAFGSQ
jgi:hypothetical protein